MSSSSLTSGVAGRYAAALYELASNAKGGAKAIDAVESDLDGLQGLLDESDDLRRLVQSPAFTKEAQGKALAAVLDKAGIKGLTAQFIGVVADNRRLFALPGMIKAYKQMAAEGRGEIAAQVTSAIALTAAQRKTLSESLKEKLGSKVTLSETVDPSILGGLVVKVGSRMIDTSLKTKLNALKYAMKEAG
ncbi:MAG: F0F1 ATP synthase subunit delta [Hyphomicrobiales bacterium]